MALDDNETVTVVCPDCRQKFQKQVGWLKNNLAFQCGACGNSLKHDPAELLRLVNQDALEPGFQIRLRRMDE